MKSLRMAALALSVLTGCTLTSVAPMNVTPEPAGEHCAHGGVRIQVGDAAPNYVCNGADGASGDAGVAGASGLTPNVIAEPAGANCANGGVKVQVGDAPASYVCSGASGEDAAPVSVAVEPAGEHCVYGGLSVSVGTNEPSYVCHGASGESAAITSEAAGTHCAEGGVKVQVGSGAPSYVCNGANGSDGLSAAVTPVSPGAQCAQGGVAVQVGTGVVSYVCNGANGANGTDGVDGLSASISTVAPGSICAAGGISVQVGEGAPSVVCNGTNGLTPSLVTLAVGDANCPFGGLQVSVGSGSPAYVCNGAPGDAGVNGTNGTSAIVEPELPGANCQYGGVSISADGPVSYACNGAPGSTGTNGTDGAAGHDALVRQTVDFTPTADCPFGSKLIEVGTDDDGDAVLEDAEVDSAFTACLGSDADGDGVPFWADTCPAQQNPGNEDDDGDGLGDACDSTPCSMGKDLCGESCVDVASDANHCGACGAACAAGDVCTNSSCVTPPAMPQFTDTGVPAQWYTSIATADWDGDGFLDLVAGTFSTEVKVFKRTAGAAKTVGYTLATSRDIGGDVYGVGVADVDGDGRLDVLTAGPNGSPDSRNAVLIQGQTGNLEAERTMHQAHGAAFYGWGVSVINAGLASQSVVWLSTEGLAVGRGLFANGAFSQLQSYPDFSGENSGLVTVDLDGDGDLDALYGRNAANWSPTTGGIALHLNDGAGQFPLAQLIGGQDTFSANPLLSRGPMATVNPAGLAAGDFNGDGAVDLALVNDSVGDAANGGYGVWIGLRTSANGAMPAYAWSRIATSNRMNLGAAVGDVTGDGNADLVLDGRVYANQGVAPWFSANAPANLDLGGQNFPIVRDFNNDGANDLGVVIGGTLHLHFR